MIARFPSMVSFSDFWKCFFTVLIPETGKVTDSNLLNAWPKKNICKKPLPKKPWDRDASLPKNFPQKGSLSTDFFFTNAASPTKKPWWEKPHDVATVAPHPRRPKRQDLENTWPMRWGSGRILGWILSWMSFLEVNGGEEKFIPFFFEGPFFFKKLRVFIHGY